MGNKAVLNRPFKFGERDRREFIVEDSEVSLIAINDTNANPIFLGRAKPNTALSDAKWQIRKITYDSEQGVTRVQWAIDSENAASTDYEFIWSSFSTPLTITGITKANPAVVSVSSIGSLINGDKVVIQNVDGMTEVNFDGSNLYTVANISGNTFQLQGINSTSYGAYVSGGTVSYGEVFNYQFG